jgi:hypothetical protein
MPFIHNKFSELYGYGNLDSVFYFLTPAYVLVKFSHVSIFRRLLYSGCFVFGYSIFKILYTKEYRNFLINIISEKNMLNQKIN